MVRSIWHRRIVWRCIFAASGGALWAEHFVCRFVASRRSRSFVSNSLASKPSIAAEGGWEGVCSNGLKHECERSARGPYDRAPVEESERQQNQRSDHGFQHNGGPQAPSECRKW